MCASLSVDVGDVRLAMAPVVSLPRAGLQVQAEVGTCDRYSVTPGLALQQVRDGRQG